MSRALLALLALALASCSCGARPPPVPSPTPLPPTVPTAVFDVHEWGLLDVTTSGTRLVAGPPGGPVNWYAPRRKPVLYFHLGEGTTALDASVTVTVPAPGIVERFPLGDLSPDSLTLTWSALRIRPESCHVTGAPSAGSVACRTPDDLCEATQLATYETADAACITEGRVDFNHLFYRANGPPPPLPFDITIQGTQVSLRHARATDVVGPILYVHNQDGAVTVATIPIPALGQSVAAPPPTSTDVAAAQHALDAAMEEVGLTPDELAAFDRAWASDLFGVTAVRRDLRMSGPQDYLLYVMPASLVDGASHVVVTPTPRTFRRFMLVRVAV